MRINFLFVTMCCVSGGVAMVLNISFLLLSRLIIALRHINDIDLTSFPEACKKPCLGKFAYPIFSRLFEVVSINIQIFLFTIRHIDDIDLFSGGLSEINLPGSLVGPTFSCLIALHFKRAKEGDRFWFENNFPTTGFTEGKRHTLLFYILTIAVPQ